MKTLKLARFVQFAKLLVSLSTIFAFLYGSTRVVVSVLSFNVSAFEGEWTLKDDVYLASIHVEDTTEVCLCPAYKCETMMEATLIAKPTVWGWREFVYFKDPQLKYPPRPKSMQPRRPMTVLSVFTAEVCYDKAAGSNLDLRLEEIDGKLLLTID